MHHVKALFFVVAVAHISGSAHAACTGAVTSLAEQSGGPAIHVTVVDQNCNPLSPSAVSWSGQGNVSIVADTTGFNFAAPPGTGAVTVTATAKNGTVTASLQDVVTMPTVTSIGFTSP
jgi:ABC-type nitrate/sulfonate/bicarbonate transport system substrate-binding protein